MIAVAELLKEALHHPQTDRSYMASKLLESLDDDEDEISEEWLVEIRRRVQEVKDNTATMIPHDEVMASVKASVAQVRLNRCS
jgi:putative addiction module component (TIGR02574 family)